MAVTIRGDGTASENLNADKLDGSEGSAFAKLSEGGAFAGPVTAPNLLGTEQVTGTFQSSSSTTTNYDYQGLGIGVWLLTWEGAEVRGVAIIVSIGSSIVSAVTDLGSIAYNHGTYAEPYEGLTANGGYASGKGYGFRIVVGARATQTIAWRAVKIAG